MTYSVLFYVALAAFFFNVLLIPSTEAKLYMTVLFNNGTVGVESACNANDSRLLDDAIGIEGKDDGDDDDDDDDDEDDRRRRLKTIDPRCKEKCKGYVPGSCRAMGCVNRRRRTATVDPRQNRLAAPSTRKLDDDDDDDNNLVCSAGLSELKRDIDKILPKLSPTCRAVVQGDRVDSCFDDVHTERWIVSHCGTPILIQSFKPISRITRRFALRTTTSTLRP